MKNVYWRIKSRPGPGAYRIAFWTKSDRSNELHFITVSLAESALKAKIEAMTGMKKFCLCHNKE